MKQTESRQYPLFVYGSLLDGFWNEKIYLQNNVRMRRTAWLKGGKIYHLTSKNYPILLRGEGVVKGELVHIRPEIYDDVIQAIDEMEGYYGKANPKNLYDRVLIEVYTKNPAQTENAMVYCYPRNKPLPEQILEIPSGDWAEFMREKHE